MYPRTIAPHIKNYLTWFEDERIKIEFDQVPQWDTLEYPPKATPEEIKDIDEKPYIVLKDFWSRITYNGIQTFIYIPKGYRWNGANIPGLFWYLIGTPDSPKFRLASLIHDWLCEHHEDSRNDRYLSTLIFCSLCKVSGVTNWRIKLMFIAVDKFQKYKGYDLKGNKWEEEKEQVPQY